MKLKQVTIFILSISMFFSVIISIPSKIFNTNTIISCATDGRLYNQMESKWRSPAFEPVVVNGVTHYPSKENVGGNTLYDGGCSIFSFCNAIYALNGSIADPVEVGWWGCNNKGFWPGYQGANPWQLYSNIESSWGDKLGFSVSNSYQNGSANDSLLKNHLKSGGVAVAHITGHFIALAGYDENNGKFLVIDSACMYGLPSYGWVAESKLKNGGSCVTAYVLFKNNNNIIHMDISGQSLPDERHEPGRNFGVYGTISANPQITAVWGGVYYQGTDTAVDGFYCYAEPFSYSYNLHGYFNDALIFDNLPVGYYTYRICGRDTNGTEYTLINHNFRVGDPPPPFSDYTVWLNASGGDVSPGSIIVQTDGVYNGLPTPSRYGYDFTGWFDDSGRQVWDGVGIYTNAEHTLYAHWNQKPITVYLNANGGLVSPDTVQVSFDGNYNNLPNPVRDGYNFIGWFTTADGGTQVDFNSVCNTVDEHTLYAHWDKNKIMITFNAMGGTVETANKLIVYDNKYGVLPIPERTGYEFKGWYLEESCTNQITSTSVVNIKSNQDVYAKWELKKYYITFDANGGNVDVTSKQD